LRDIPLTKSDDLETMTDAISVTPGGISTGLGKNKLQEKAIDWVTNTVVKDGTKKVLKAVHD
jgi:hypothetical protein